MACAPVSALRHVAGIAQPLHQDIPRTTDALNIPSRPRSVPLRSRSLGVRNDDVEGILRPSAGLGRVGQRTDQFYLLEHGAGATRA